MTFHTVHAENCTFRAYAKLDPEHCARCQHLVAAACRAARLRNQHLARHNTNKETQQ